MPVPPADESLGRVLGNRYRLEHVIGRGGTATVYRAVDEALGRAVAIKLFNLRAEPEREEGEIALLASLEHHAIVTLLDAGVDWDAQGRPTRYIVMALVTGSTLSDRLAIGAIAPRHIGEIGYDMAEALHYVHAHNVIHRDIKPSNVLLVDYGSDEPRARAMLTDFGIARADDVDRLTAEGVTTGTAAYLSPEQASGGTVGPESDVYSLGLVLLECFTRAVEFPGTVIESVVARLTREPAIPEHLPEHWHQLLTAMLARDAAARPSRRELVSMLRQAVILDSSRHKDDADDDLVFGSGSRGRDTGVPGILDTLPTDALDRVTAIAARLFNAPVGIVSVVDRDRTWFASHYGADVEEIVRSVDLSQAAPPEEHPVVVPDARTDPRAQDSPLVTGPLGLRFYVGVPLKRGDGQTIGTLSVLDFVPGTASEAQIASLKDLAALVVAQLDLRHEGLRTTREVPPAAPVAAATAQPPM
ncbi:serine/threonine protein kinase [Marisediminicola sp. UYEF4]|uniref:protein kinase domain-containing protein n=1 Tax=Marisediminicola sp. UYEF4 TaxID=1756384 RepID=UPI00339448A4